MILRKVIQSKRLSSLQTIRSKSSSSTSLSSSSALFISGHGWTGAFGTGPETITSPQTSDVSPDERENNFTRINEVQDMGEIVNVAAGWGHTVLLCKDKTDQNSDGIKMYVAGRPYDFQALLRLNRLPSFLRRAAVTLSLSLDEEKDLGFGEKILKEIISRNDNDNQNQNNPLAEFRKSVFPNFQEIKLPNGDMPAFDPSNNHKTLAASAGFTAVIGKSGKAYTFGLNKSGQCGVGDTETIHIWDPLAIKLTNGISGSSDNGDDECKVTDVALGLQHGLVLDENGSIHSFGKGSRGQLGTPEDSVLDDLQVADTETGLMNLESNTDFEYSPVKVGHFDFGIQHGISNGVLSNSDAMVTNISAGWNHSAAITKSNHLWIWGKNVLIDPNASGPRIKAMDSIKPVNIKGLPVNLTILDVSCGSHHTSILMEDGSVYATGIATDTNDLIGGDFAVQIIQPGIIDMPVKQFKSHFDRTTIVAGENGRQILEVQLWSTEQLRSEAIFEPAWVEDILDNCHGINHVHRGWHHTIIAGDSFTGPM
jgi:hypothetical protein